MIKSFIVIASVITTITSIDLKCDVDNIIADENGVCIISNIISNHEGDEFTSYINGVYEEIVFENSTILKFPREVVGKNNVMSLRLMNCGLKFISPGTFTAVTSLLKLYLTGNRLEVVNHEMFDGLESLQFLDLSENKIKDVGSDTFHGMEHLEHVNLAMNKLSSLSLVLKSPDALTIDVRDNVDLNAVDYTCNSDALSCSVLILDDNTIDLTCDSDNQVMDGVCLLRNTQVGESSVFRVIRKWSELGYGYYRERQLNTEYFKEIIFVNSSLNKLPTALFDYYVTLEYLNVSASDIQSLDPYSFKNASTLVDVDLSLNLIAEVGPNTFDGAKQLSVIDLSQNRIETVDKHAFSMLTKLTSLILAGNQIKTLDLELRFNFPMVLNVSNCRTRLLRVTSYTETYIMPYSASVIDACNNELGEIDIIRDGPIVTLMLENNTGRFNMSDVTSINSLTTLSLRNVSTEISNGAFVTMFQLENLDLSYTNLTLKYGLFGSNTKLRKLDLSYNHLKEIDFCKLVSLRELEELVIDGNGLTQVDTFNMLMTFSRLKKVSFLDNPFYCDVLSQMMGLLRDHHIEIEYPLDGTWSLEDNNVHGIGCQEYDKTSVTRNLLSEKQLDRMERTFLTIYAIKKAYL